jgi:hypothetical protein
MDNPIKALVESFLASSFVKNNVEQVETLVVIF